MRKIIATTALVLASVFMVALPAHAETSIPEPTGSVVDSAHILKANQVTSIEDQIAEIKKTTTHAVAVLTVDSLKGESIESYSLKVANSWGVGSAERNDGVLLVLAMKEHKIRIEVGSGIHDLVSDSTASNIIDTKISPNMKSGDYNAAISSGVSAIGDSLSEKAPVTPAESVEPPLDWGFIFLCLVIIMAGAGIVGAPFVIWNSVKANRRHKLEVERAAEYHREEVRLREVYREERRKAQEEHEAFLKTPEGIEYQKVMAEKERIAEKARKAKAAENARLKKIADAEAKKFYNSLDSATVSRIKRASKSSRRRLLNEELRKAQQTGSYSGSVSSDTLLSTLMLYSVFSASDSYSSRGSSSSSSSSSYSSYDSGSSSFGGGGFDGGGSSGGW